jgi:hypothetical protein
MRPVAPFCFQKEEDRMKSIDAFKASEFIESIEEQGDEVAAVVELMVGNELDSLPDNILYRLGNLLRHLMDGQKDLIDEFKLLIDEAPAPAANHAEAPSGESAVLTDFESEDTRLTDSCQDLSKQPIIKEAICKIYGTFFSASQRLNDARLLLSEMEEKIDTVSETEKGLALKKTFFQGLGIIDGVHHSLRSNTAKLEAIYKQI